MTEIVRRSRRQRSDVDRAGRAVPADESSEGEQSELEELLQDPQVAIEVAAATLDGRLHELIACAFDARPDVSKAALASTLHVTPGRVSQVVGGDDPLRVTTVARYLRALGYELEVRARSVEADAPALQESRRRKPAWTFSTVHVHPLDAAGFTEWQMHVVPAVSPKPRVAVEAEGPIFGKVTFVEVVSEPEVPVVRALPAGRR